MGHPSIQGAAAGGGQQVVANSPYLIEDDYDNTPPEAFGDAEMTHDTPVMIDVLTNDFDMDGDPIQVTGHTNPTRGTVVDNGGGSFTYTPDANFFDRTDSFNYTISDGRGGTDSATVYISVMNTPPEAFGDLASTYGRTPVAIDVLLNDFDMDGDPIQVTSFTGASHGTVKRSLRGYPGSRFEPTIPVVSGGVTSV